MKFIYQYRTPDNVQHEGTICAATKDAAYDQLRARGVRPGRMVEAPGLFNKLFGKGKRWIAIGALGGTCLALGFFIFVAFADFREDSALGALHSAIASRLASRDVPAPYRPSAEFLALRADVESLLADATNDVWAAREAVKELFRERYPKLPRNPREREEAQALYGRVTFRLDDMESRAFRGPHPDGD